MSMYSSFQGVTWVGCQRRELALKENLKEGKNKVFDKNSEGSGLNFSTILLKVKIPTTKLGEMLAFNKIAEKYRQLNFSNNLLRK